MENSHNSQNKEIEPTKRPCFQVVEYLFQNVLPMHGEGMDKYDTRVIKKRVSSKASADALVEKLRLAAQSQKLDYHLRYEVVTYTVSNVKKKR